MQSKPGIRIVAEPTREARKVRVGRVPFVHERACDRAGARVEIFVRAPHREIDVPIVQCQGHIADRVGEIEANDDPAVLGRGRDFRNVEQLTREKVHAADHYHRKLVAVLLN